ncbi:36213_t:CDS:2 [Gigaspora margarita]|uniref:36213_t:CDS:1 n=1 Tax=Gigaspora margarita TaxID=4874 RepID=A0ABN7UQM1_GIGMA|nr:36213_t:CDS:2 [Gigaspora margarita]
MESYINIKGDINKEEVKLMEESIRIIEDNYRKLNLIKVRAAGKSLEKRNEYVLGESRKYDNGMPIGFEFNRYPKLLILSKILDTIKDYQTLKKGLIAINYLLRKTKNEKLFRHIINTLK